MRFRFTGLFIFLTALFFCGCNRKSSGRIDAAGRVHINRFDSALLQWIDSDDPAILAQIKRTYPRMLDVLDKALFQRTSPDSSVFFDNLINYYSEPTLHSLYKDAVGRYAADSPEMTRTAEELSHGFMRMQMLFPSMRTPAVYMHVSGLQQNVIVADSLLSCSIDKYLGADYPLYKDFFYAWQRKSMIPERMAKDCLKAWLKSEYPYRGKDNVLLDRMVYEGKIIYVLEQLGKDYNYRNIMSLTEEEYKWCLDYEAALWTTMIERKHLYTPDITTASKYFQPSPSTFISEKAPGDLGCFTGYRIVQKYMKRTKSSCEELMNNNNVQDLLKESGYKP
ncbi:MAG: gliding motility protein GldB [Tannerella sp.]|nr:gliding motility protein GldB [Tannerella sp.]